MVLTLPTVGGDNNTWGTELNAWLNAAHSGEVNLLNYEPAADGTTDDTDAIATAIAALSTGDTLKIPPGNVIKGDNTTRHILPEGCTLDARGATLDEVLLQPKTLSTIWGARFLGDGYAIQSDSAAYDPFVTIKECAFEGLSRGIYVENTNGPADHHHSHWTVANNAFDGCSYGFFSVFSRDMLIAGNHFKDSATSGVGFFAGRRNRIVNNTVDGGTVGIQFVFNRPSVAYWSIVQGNVVSGNTIRDYDEEGIAFDVNGSDGDNAGVIETDTVSATGTSGANSTVTLADAGWATHPQSVYYGYHMTFLTGSLAGRSFFIGDVNANTGTFVFTPDVMTATERGLIAAGNYVSVGSPMIGNVITGNHVDATGSLSGHGTTNGIILFGNCFHNTISGNVVEHGNIEINSIEGIDLPTVTYAGNAPRAMSLANVVASNTVTRGDILFDHLGFGAFEDNPTFQTLHNLAVGNVVLTGDIIADGHTVKAAGNAATTATSNGGSFT